MFGLIVRCFNALAHRAFAGIAVGGSSLRLRTSFMAPSPSGLAAIAESSDKQDNTARLLVGMLYRCSDGRPISTEHLFQLSAANCCQLLQTYPVRYGAFSRNSGLSGRENTSPSPESEADVDAFARLLARQLLSIEEALLTAELVAAQMGMHP